MWCIQVVLICRCKRGRLFGNRTVMSISLWLRSFLHRVRDLELDELIFKRPPTRRRLIVICCAIFFVIYFFAFYGNVTQSPEAAQQCVHDRLKSLQWDSDDSFDLPEFVGNGYIAVDGNGILRLKSNNSRSLDVETKFKPFVDVIVDGHSTAKMPSRVSIDFNNGILQKLYCFLVNDECSCFVRKFWAHRTKKNLIFEEVHFINPTKSSLNVRIERKHPNEDAQRTNGPSSKAPYQYSQEIVSNGQSHHMKSMCSSAPGSVVVAQRREDTLRFLCAIVYGETANSNDQLAAGVFANAQSSSSFDLDREHSTSWRELSQPAFNIAFSKAPSVLNALQMNATKYVLMSSIAMSPSLPTDTSLCFNGHSTLLFPSRLWTDLSTPDATRSLVDTWLVTLEKMGCAKLINGAQGLSEAFELSIAAASYHSGHLEVQLDAEDLHREMLFEGVAVGSSRARIRFALDSYNVPFIELSSLSDSSLYACDGGCLDTPVTVGRKSIVLPVKITKPRTSILYLATSRKHLDQLRSAIHVSEVIGAPAHEEELVNMHRHGSQWGSLPTSFWVLLIVVLIAFHIFLAKLLWNEWKRNDMTPYNPYLRNRYYARSH